MNREDNALELCLLGGFSARLASGEPVVLPTRKTRALLAYLALRPNRTHPRESLAALLWGERPDARALNSLSQAVTALRKGLAKAEPAPLITQTDSIAFRADAAYTDVATFEACTTSSAAEDLERALALYTGDLLAGIGVHDPAFEDWLELERERLRTLAVEALSRLMSMRAAAGEHEHAVSAAKRLLEFDPVAENAHRVLMQTYAAQGQIGLALRQYRHCTDLLRRELGIEPDAETARLHDELLAHRGSASAGGSASTESAARTPNGEAPDMASGPIARVRTETTGPGPQHEVPRRRRAGMGVIVMLLAAGAILLWTQGGREPAGTGSLPEQPSIAVLPLLNLSGDPTQEYFADGMTEDLITDLAKISEIFVISRNSAFTFKDRTVPVEQIAQELGVRYVLEGSVRRADDRLRINVQLIDGVTGGHLWAERYDTTTADVFDVQDRITRRVVDALALELLPEEVHELDRRETTNVAAHDAYLLGLSAYYRRTPGDNARAVEHFESAIALDPGYSAAYTALAKVYARAMVAEQAYADALGIHWSDGYTRARQLLEHGMAEPNADHHVLRSWLALRKHQHTQAVAEAERALELNPNDPDALEALSEALILAGRPDEGIEFARRAMRRNPLLLGRPLYLLGLAAFARGDAESAVAHAERAIDQAPTHRAEISGLLAAALGQLGLDDRAEAAFREFSEAFVNRPDRAWSVRTLAFANPRFHTWRRIDLAWSVYSFPFADRRVLERFAAGLRAAGAPGSVGGYLSLHPRNRLGGEDIRALLFGHEIEGTDFWLAEHHWRERRAENGRVDHFGYPIHPGLPTTASGQGWIHDDRLCERWPALSTSFEICVAVFRVPGEAARARWGDYVMVTDTGPHPFSPVR